MRAYRMRLFIVILCAGCLAGIRAAAQQAELINGVAVIVNEKIITYQEVERFVGPALETLERQFAAQPQAMRERLIELRRDGTEQLVERLLILHEFRTAGYNLPESVIDDTIKDRTRARFGDRVTLARTLKSQGITLETYRQQTRDEIIVDALRAKNISQELIISPQKIAAFYEANKTNYSVGAEIKLRTIDLVKPKAGDNGETKKRADEILGKIKEGATFEEMARSSTDGPLASVGGDRGWVERSALRKELAEVAFALKPGQRSDVIDLPDACYLLLVENKRDAHVRPLSEVRDEIEKFLLVKERARLQQRWVDRMKTKSFVRYF